MRTCQLHWRPLTNKDNVRIVEPLLLLMVLMLLQLMMMMMMGMMVALSLVMRRRFCTAYGNDGKAALMRIDTVKLLLYLC
jgi:hypothetical protein